MMPTLPADATVRRAGRRRLRKGRLTPLMTGEVLVGLLDVGCTVDSGAASLGAHRCANLLIGRHVGVRRATGHELGALELPSLKLVDEQAFQAIVDRIDPSHPAAKPVSTYENIQELLKSSNVP